MKKYYIKNAKLVKMYLNNQIILHKSILQMNQFIEKQYFWNYYTQIVEVILESRQKPRFTFF